MDKALKFDDIIKKSFLNMDGFSSVSMIAVLAGLVLTLLVGIFIFYIYKKTYRGVVYSYTFNISLVLMCLITSLIIMTISSNVVLSLGMVGALSIVRFRTAIKDPMDVVFMFWAIAAGIASGARIYSIAIVGSIFIGMILLIFINYEGKLLTYLLIIHHNDSANDNVKEILNKLEHKVKSKTVSKGSIELTVELKIKGDNTAFVNQISEIEGVNDAVLVSYNGDYAA